MLHGHYDLHVECVTEASYILLYSISLHLQMHTCAHQW